MAIACVSIPNFALRVEILQRPELDGLPLALRSTETQRPVIVDCTPEAVEQGVRPGMLPREALAMCPNVVTIMPNPVRYSSVFGGIIDALEQFSPAVEPDEAGRCYVDLTGLERLLGPPEQAARTLIQAVSPILRPRAGVAPGKFTALVAANSAAPGASQVIPAQDVKEFLAGMPVSVLPVSYGMVTRLEQLGLNTLADLGALPLSAVQARFGPEGRDAWRLIHGQDDRPVTPRQQEAIAIEEITLPAPASSRETFLFGLKQLVIQAFTREELRSRNVRQTLVRAQLEGGGSWEQTLTLKEPAGRDRLIEILGRRLAGVELPGALESLRIELIGFAAEHARQESLLSSRPKQLQQIIDAVRQLKQRYGTSPIYRVVEVEPWSRIPERRRALISFDP